MRQLLLYAILFSYVSATSAQGLAEHTVVDESPLSNGKRIQVNVEDPNLSKTDCAALIDKYRSRAGAEGQVSVHKPSTVKALGGSVLPFCIDNLDGSGVSFDITFHPDTE